MLAMKNQVPLYFDKYDLLVRQHCQNLTDAEISAAENAAKAPVANFLATRQASFCNFISAIEDQLPMHCAVLSSHQMHLVNSN